MSEIEVRHLTKTFEQKGVVVEALKDISLNIEAGDIYGIIGMSSAVIRRTETACGNRKSFGVKSRNFAL